MTAPNARLGLGATVEFMTSGVEVNVTKADWDGLARTAHDTSHLGTARPGAGNVGSRTKIPGKLVEPGTIKCEGHYAGDVLRLMEEGVERIRVTLPLEDGQNTPEAFEFDGFATSVKPFTLEADALAMVSFDLTISGEVEFTDAT